MISPSLTYPSIFRVIIHLNILRQISCDRIDSRSCLWREPNNRKRRAAVGELFFSDKSEPLRKIHALQCRAACKNAGADIHRALRKPEESQRGTKAERIVSDLLDIGAPRNIGKTFTKSKRATANDF